MKQRHIDIRIRQCLELAKASHCPRRKLAAMLIDPHRNVILADGYNGGPRGAEGLLCAGHYCERNGLTMDDLEVLETTVHHHRSHGWAMPPRTVHAAQVKANGHVLHTIERGLLDGQEMSRRIDGPGPDATPEEIRAFLTETVDDDQIEMVRVPTALEKAREWAEELCERTPAIESGTRMELGCHHAEMNVICNAAAGGVRCAGAWMIVLAEPCMMCAKMIHHAGIEKVILVGGGYLGGTAGVDYLKARGVKVQIVEGPPDPRISADASV